MSPVEETDIDMAVSVPSVESSAALDMIETERLPEGDQEKLHVGQLRIFDKMILGSIWAVSFLYALMTEQVVSKQAGVSAFSHRYKPCRESGPPSI